MLNAAIFEHLFSLYQNHDSIQPMLVFLGTFLGADRVLVLEKKQEKLILADAWASAECYAVSSTSCPISRESIALASTTKIKTVSFGSNLTLFSENIGEQHRTNTFIACDLVHNNAIVGFLIFEKFCATPPWSLHEAESLALVGQFVGTALRQQHILQTVRAKQQNTHNLLNGVPFYIYVIEKETHHLLYFNEAVLRAFPKAALGLPCYKVFWNNKNICPFCPSRNLGTANCVTSVLPHSPMWKTSDVSLSNIIWDNRIPAHVVLITEHIPSELERKEQLRHEAFTAAMAAVYDYVFDINLETGNYELLAANNKVPCIVKMYGKYEDILQHVDEYIYSDFIEQFKTIFSLENMRLGLACEMEFLTFQGTEHRWKLRQSFPYTQKNGSRHMLSVTHDIHNAKIAALRKVQEESNIQVALRNSYSRIYLLDLQDKKFSCLFINDLIKPVSLCERFDEDLKTLGEMVVHPEDRTAFYSFYSIQSIQKALDKKLKLTIEYRCQDAQGEYKWFSTCIEPLPYTTTKAMVLVRDITNGASWKLPNAT